MIRIPAVMAPAALALGLTLSAAAPAPSLADVAPVYTGFLSQSAVDGYDPVAYFTEGRPVEGSSEHQLDYKGATWSFATAENKAAFEADPEAYAPQFGGYCAWAISQGYTAKGDPKHWRIVDGKLYLNYNASVQERWESDIPGHVASAEGNWPGIIGE